MKIFKLDKIHKKIFLLVSLTVLVSLLGTSTLNYIIAKNELQRSNNIILENAIEAALSEINRNYTYTTYEDQWMTEEQAMEVSLSSFQYMLTGEYDSTSSATAVVDETSAATENTKHKFHRQNLGEQGYFFVINSKGDIITHPFLTENINDLQSVDGRYIIQDLIALAKTGGGSINYALAEDVSLLTDSKTVYANYFPQWDWVVAAVIFDKDLNRGSNIIAINSTIGIITALILSIALSLLFSRKITNPLKSISTTLQKVAEGDLTINKIEIHTKDETKLLGDSTNRLIDGLKNMVGMMNGASQKLSSFSGKISESAEIVSESTTQVTTAITQMAEQTEEQYKGTLEGLNKVTLLGEDIKETADASTRIETVVQQNIQLKEEGLTSVHDLMDANNENNANSIEIENVINRINTHSQDIGEIIKIIANVAKQTNLLALNASIEASRAGEHGSGFAVVAEEIGKLANETKIATENVRHKIGDMQREAEAATNFVGINKQGVDKINRAVNQTESIISEISTGLQQLIEGINLIVDKNFEINKKKDDILVLLHNVSESAENNSASIEELSATAQEQTVTVIEISESMSQLNDMAQELDKLINEFKVD